ncbi:hypothetical protein [Streptomyces xanthophaeus]|uniref:Uncharacterized protein n=1 Tax=Streptomyces xanthophaeus TaxID=67385 RepID=A0A919LGU2_9ACTN|nr:hypothetical protein [Streptomyces xanthophaeus]GHI90441.1 hypothetical protein Sxan_78050 [Streptomyces xanthophaeus]
MLKSLFAHLVWATGLYTVVAFWFVAPRWTLRVRMPRGRIFRIARRTRVAKSVTTRAARAVGALSAQAPAGAEIPEIERLEQRLDDYRCSSLSIMLVWLSACPGVLAALFIALNSDIDDGYPWLMPLLWGGLGGIFVLAEVDRRMLNRSLPLEHTTLMAVGAVEACRVVSETEHGEVRGHSRSSSICAAIDDLCAAIGRQAELEPRRTDPVHRARLRAEALEVVRNLHAAKVRLVEGDEAALTALFAILGSLLARTAAPTHLGPRPLVSAEVLAADPDWEGPPLRNESVGAKVLGYGLFVAGLVAVGKLLSLMSLPEPLTWLLLGLMASAGHGALKHWLPVPALPTELLSGPTATPPHPEPAADRAGAGQLR